MKLQRCIYCQAFCLSSVHQRDTTKVVVHVRYQRISVETQSLTQELPFHLIVQVHIIHLYTLLLCTSMIILRLHLHKLQVGIHVCSEAYFLSVRMSPLMLAIHIEILRIKICGIIQYIPLTACLLDIILPLDHLQEKHQLIHGGHEFRVSAVH